MTCETTLNANADFGTFIRCWCSKNTGLDKTEKRKRAYYWAWQSHNWYSTLLYLNPASASFLTDTEWWLLDPTPQSAAEAQVDQEVWDTKLDPDKQPWLLFEDICQQFQREAISDDALMLIDELLGTSAAVMTPSALSAQQREENKFVCSVCQEEWQHPEVYNILHQEYVNFVESLGVPESDTTMKKFQLTWGGVETSPNAVSFDVTVPLTATLIRRVAQLVNLPFDSIKHDVLLFLGQPSASRGPIVHSECKHGVHEECIYSWNKTVQENYKKQLEGNNLFANLRNLGSSRQSPLKSGLSPYKCLMKCPGTVTHVYVKPQPEPVALTPDYVVLESKLEDAEWGPYRLKRGALVWVYPQKRHLGGDYAGYLGILQDFYQDPNNPECSFGGCFRVQTLVPDSGIQSFPVSAVFDISFIEFDMLPTRNEVTEMFAPPLEQSYTAYRPYPVYITEPLGYGDWEVSQVTRDPDRAKLQATSQQLMNSLRNAATFAQFETLLAQHREQSESTLVARAAGYNPDNRMSAAALWDRIKRGLGAYTSSPPIQVQIESQGNAGTIAVELKKLVNQNPVLARLKLLPYHIIVFLYYARHGYDILPQYSTVLLPLLRTLYRDLPQQLTPLPTNRPVTLWPITPSAATKQTGKRPASFTTESIPPPVSKKARVSSSSSSSFSPSVPASSLSSSSSSSTSASNQIMVNNVLFMTRKLREMGFATPIDDVVKALLNLEGYLSLSRIDLNQTSIAELPIGSQDDIFQRVINYLLSMF